jgi:tetratricopeptide (TPR) repeat protein
VLRIVLLLLLLLAAVWSYHAVSWYFGDTLAEYFNTEANSLDVARRAAWMAPGDPMTHWRVAETQKNLLSPEQQAQSIAEYEKTVSLSPTDYRYWMSLGIAYEQAGELTKAEHALKRAVALAPNYAYPHWYLGNLFVRSGRYDEAFAEIHVAARAEPEMLPQLFNLIWQVNGDDLAAARKAVGNDPVLRAQFAVYLLGILQIDNGMEFWNGMTADEKRANSATGSAVITLLEKNLRYHAAAKVWNDLTEERFHAQVDRIFDGSFEELVDYSNNPPFGWQVQRAPQVDITIDGNRGHNGARSLRMVFEVRGDADPVTITQLVAVQPENQYEFECFVSTDSLVSGSRPQIDIIDPTTNGVIISSAPAPRGSAGWTPIQLSFQTGKTEAVIVRIIRGSCVNKETPLCPIFGSVWYDDFTLKRKH